jgi:hypothetical protein
VGADVVGAHDLAARVLHFDFIRAEAGDGVQGELLARQADGGDEDDRGRSDDHAEHREQETGLGGVKAVQGEMQGFAEGDGGASAAQRVVKGVAGWGCGRHAWRGSC